MVLCCSVSNSVFKHHYHLFLKIMNSPFKDFVRITPTMQENSQKHKARHTYTLSQKLWNSFLRVKFNFFIYINRLSTNHVHTCTHKLTNHCRTLKPVVSLHKDQILKAIFRNYITFPLLVQSLITQWEKNSST